jgi:hypothetical protein
VGCRARGRSPLADGGLLIHDRRHTVRVVLVIHSMLHHCPQPAWKVPPMSFRSVGSPSGVNIATEEGK